MSERNDGTWKTCPHCGGSDIRHDAHGNPRAAEYQGDMGTIYSMCCYDCGATFPNRYKLELLKDAWNRRAYVNGEQDKKDAARYRYLRDTPPWKSDIAIVLSETVGDDISYICQEALDKMVDERACENGVQEKP